MSGGAGVITLVGMPGGGKSTVGRLLARRLGRPFFDVDKEIELAAGCSIEVLFEREGEAAFRDRESDVLVELVGRDSAVIATGGGSVLRADNRTLLREATLAIYLQASIEDLWRRVRYNARRPLLQVADPFARLQTLMKERQPLYAEVARMTVVTGAPSTKAVVDLIVAQLHSGSTTSPDEAGPAAGRTEPLASS